MADIIVLDFEWNDGRRPGGLNELLQIGAVKLPALGEPIEDTFCSFIKPRVHKRYSKAAKLLPELEESLQNGIPAAQAIRDFTEWWGDETEFALWGTGDLSVLKENARHYGIDIELPATYYDLQAAFSATLGVKNAVALNGAVDYCGIPQSFTFHNALHDSLYTALVGGYIPTQFLDDALRSSEPKPKRTAQQTRKKGVGRGQSKLPNTAKMRKLNYLNERFEVLQDALEFRQCRTAACPYCSRRERVNIWYTADGENYYANFSCPEHGKFFVHLSVRIDEGGRYYCGVAVLDDSVGSRALWRTARKVERITLPAIKEPRKRRHRHHRRKNQDKPAQGGETQ